MMLEMIVFWLIILTKEVVNGEDSALDLMMDPRCMDSILDVNGYKNARRALTIDKNLYEESGKLVCMEAEDKRQLSQLTERDDWPRWISLIGNLTTDKEGGFVCHQFKHFYSTAFKALGNKQLRRNNCSAITTFCDDCELGCKHVSPFAYSSRETMVTWAVESLGMRDSVCQRTWISSNIKEGLRRNSTWLLDVKHACKVCYMKECSTVRGKFVSNLLFDQLAKQHGDAQAVWDHLCRYPTVLGLFDYDVYHLEERFNFFDEYIELMKAFQSNSWWAMPVIIISIIGFTLLFHTENRFREWFNLDTFIDSYKRFKNDKIMQWLITRLATKAEILRQKVANGLKRITRKKSKAPKKTSAVSKKPDTQQRGNLSMNKRLSDGKVSGPRRGPAGRGTRSA